MPVKSTVVILTTFVMLSGGFFAIYHNVAGHSNGNNAIMKSSIGTGVQQKSSPSLRHQNSDGSWFKIPGEFNFNKSTYFVQINTHLSKPGKLIGTGKTPGIASAVYPVYEIPGKDPTHTVAIDMHGIYFVSVLHK